MSRNDEFDNDTNEALFSLNFTLPNKQKVSGNFYSDTTIDYEKLEQELVEAPSKFAFWSVLLAEQKYKVSVVEKQVTRRRAKVYETMKNNDNGVKLTKYMMDELVAGDDEILELEGRLILERKIESKLWAAVEALKMKSEHLRSLAGFKKQELRDLSQ